MRKRPFPLHVRLAISYTLFFGAVLTVISISVLVVTRQVLMRELDQHLQASANLINADFDASNRPLQSFFSGPEFLLHALPPSVAGLEAPGLYAEAIAPDGTIVATSASLAGRSIPLAPALRTAALRGVTQIVETELDNAPALMVVHPLADDRVARGVLVLTRSLGAADRTLQAVAVSLAIVGVIALCAAASGGAWLIARALQPVGEVARTARQIVQATDLARRVPPASGTDELSQLTSTVNEMLTRMEQLFTTQQRFFADVSHELRTPLAAMRSTIEVLRRGAARDRQMLDDSLADLERETQRLSRLANDLLLLARADLGMRLEHVPVALDELVLEVARELRSLADGVRLIPVISEQVEILGDRDRLKQALLNLAVNAIQHTTAGQSVWVELLQEDSRVILQVRDTGTGIAAEHLPHLFERFYRVDQARSRSTSGAGLGLAIVQWVAEAHGGRVDAQSALDQGSIFRIHLPSSNG